MKKLSRDQLRLLRRNLAFAIKSSWKVSPVLFITQLLVYSSQGLLPLVTAYYAARLIDQIIAFLANGTIEQSAILASLAVLGAINFIYNQTFRIESYISRKFWFLYDLFVEDTLQTKFLELDHSFYEDTSFTKHFNKVNQYKGRITRYSDELFFLFSAATQLIGAAIAIITLSPLMAIILIAGSYPLMRVQMQASSKRWRIWDDIDEDWRLSRDLHYTITDVDSVSEIKIFGLGDYFRDLWRRFFTKQELVRLELENKIEKQQILASLFEAIVQFGIDLWLVFKIFARTGFSVGNFEFYRRIVNQFSTSSSRFVIGIQNVSETGLYVNDYLDLMAMEPIVNIPTESIRLTNKVPKIEFKNVGFKYPKSEEYVLRNLSMVIEPGEDIAIVGENGAGKTTLVKLLMRFYDVTEGEILINGVNIKEIDLSSWHRQAGALFQQFNHYRYFKARRNIGVGNVDKVNDLKAIKEAAKRAKADEFINKLPAKYETVLSKAFKDGTQLSGGQWQRIAIARGFFKDSNVLILDEPTSAIDAKAEYEIFKEIHAHQKQKTTIIISHRFSTVRNANKIFVIDNGKIKESGSHEELMQIKNGTYKKMFELQAEGYK